MQQAVLQHYPHVSVRYGPRIFFTCWLDLLKQRPTTAFTNRRPSDVFTRQSFDWIRSQISKLSTISLRPEERVWLEKRCPFFTSSYLDYLQSFKFKPGQQIKLAFKEPHRDSRSGLEVGGIDLSVKGNWAETILYEIPLMSIISEAYFSFTVQEWDYVGQRRSSLGFLSFTMLNRCASQN